MKTSITSFAWLLVGLVMGGLSGYHYYERHVANEAVQQMVQEMESSANERAARAVLAIEKIESGDSQEAVRLLSSPIAFYYSHYAEVRRHDEHSRNLIAEIEQLAKTNTLVASRIAEVLSNSRPDAP